MFHDTKPVASGAGRRGGLGLSLLIAALALFVLPGAADAKKERDKIGVASFNLYLGSDLGDATRAAQQSRTDLFADEVGEVLRDVNANDFTERARTVSKLIRRREADLVGLQEVALWRVQVPTDASGLNPAAQRATTPLIDYLDTILERLNAKAKTKRECNEEEKEANQTPGNKDDKQANDCYRGYKAVVVQQEADLEFLGDFDNDPGADGRTCDLSSGTCPSIAMGSDSWTWGNDDTGVTLGEPPAPPFPVDANFDGNATDCPDGAPTTPGPPVGNFTNPNTPVCMFHGIDGDLSLTMRDVILKLKGAGVKTRNPRSNNFSNQFALPLFGGAARVTFTRGWNAVDANVRGKKFTFVNTHLESENAGTVREDQASELTAPGGPASGPNTVLVGDLNSDPNRPAANLPNGDSGSQIAINRLFAAGYRSLVTREGFATGSHGDSGDIINNPNDFLGEGWIDHILTNSEDIEGKGKGAVLDAFRNGLWSSDHGGVFVKILGDKSQD